MLRGEEFGVFPKRLWSKMGKVPAKLEYSIKMEVDFAIKCQKVLAICAKIVYNTT